MGSILKAIVDSSKPMTQWRLTYAARLTSLSLEDTLREMEFYRLIKRLDTKRLAAKRGPRRKYGEVGYYTTDTTRYWEITPKGRKLLEILERMAALMPTAPWILEQ